MNTRDHLVHHLQELYSFERDYLPLLMEMHHGSSRERLSQLLLDGREELRSEIETIERALNLLSARFKHERSAVIPAVKETTERFKHQMNPTPDQLDIHAVLEAVKIAHLVAGAYQGDIELARAIGEQDVALLLEENLERQRQYLVTLQEYVPQLIAEVSRAESRQAA